jgi:serine/threonine protein kinase
MSAFPISVSLGDVVLSTYMPEPPTCAPLNPEEWARVRGHLDAVLGLAPEARPAYLDRACAGDPRLRAELESLVAASEGTAVLDEPAMPTISMGRKSGEADRLQPGQVIGHYEVAEKIGEGGMGAVYRAVDRNLGRSVAVKVIAGASGWEEQQRLAREAKAASALNSPNIVTIYEFDSDHGRDFIVMEYVKGSTLRTLIHEHRAPLATLLDYARQAAGAIATAHAAGIVHRDLKPGNIMVTDEGVVKVLDFGLCKQQEPASDSAPDATRTQGLTKTGMVVGTPCYMSPEQAMGEPAGRLSDIFAFGVILYEIACGRRPFEGKNSQATLYQIAHKNPPAPAEVNPATPRRLAELIERCLQKEPRERPQSMDEIAAALADLALAPARPSRRGALAVAGILFPVAVVAAVWMAASHRPAAPALPPRVLTYSIEAQKPAAQPYFASPTDTFEAGWRFRVHAQSPQPGFLYLVNRGLDETGAQRFWLLYPRKGAETVLAPDREALTGWYDFDQNAGTERLWLVWSERPVDAIENALRESEAGKVVTANSAAALEQLLAGLKKGRATTGSSGEWRLEWDRGPGLPGELLELKHK